MQDFLQELKYVKVEERKLTSKKNIDVLNAAMC